MMSDELINKKIIELSATRDEDSREPNMPVSVALQEAENLYEWCRADREDLIQAGLDWNLVEELPVRAGALRRTQSLWSSERMDQQECRAEWNKLAPAAGKLRDELMHHLYFVLRDNPGENARVRRIDAGRTHADMIQDLADLAELGKKHKKKLQSIGIDTGLIDEARSQSFRLAGLPAKVKGSGMESAPNLKARNTAYYHLKEAVDEIRRVGRYVYWKNPDRLKGYSSQYIRKKNKTYRTKISRTEE